jgi:Fur family iron response transcriptional regulator
MPLLSTAALQQRRAQAGIRPTLQRLAVAGVLLPKPVHLTADQVLLRARRQLPGLSRATVYEVLQLFTTQGLLKALPIEGASTVYDSNTGPHHHFYDVQTGQVADIPDSALQVQGVAQALAGMVLEGVDVIVRVRGLRPAGVAGATG